MGHIGAVQMIEMSVSSFEINILTYSSDDNVEARNRYERAEHWQDKCILGKRGLWKALSGPSKRFEHLELT